MAKCSICSAEAKPRQDNASFPFCSARCKMVDLGKWINEEYRVPMEDSGDGLDEEGDPGDSIVRH